VLPPALLGLAEANSLGALRKMYRPAHNALFRTQALRDRRILLFQQGFLHATGPATAEAYRWDRIAEVYQNAVDHYQNGRYQYTSVLFQLVLLDGGQFKLDGFFRGARALGSHINAAVSSVLLPAAEAALAQGATLPFGPLGLSAQALAPKKRGPVPWTQIRLVKLIRGYVHVFVYGKDKSVLSVNCSQVPNLPLFSHLADRYAGKAARTPIPAQRDSSGSSGSRGGAGREGKEVGEVER
jgi:hypothetical protein